jgi:hypothetical protein
MSDREKYVILSREWRGSWVTETSVQSEYPTWSQGLIIAVFTTRARTKSAAIGSVMEYLAKDRPDVMTVREITADVARKGRESSQAR